MVAIVATVIALAVIGGAIFAVYAFTKDDDRPSNASNPPAAESSGAESPSQEAQGEAGAVTGTWEGTYTCAQGLTALNLTIREAPGSNNVLEATFSFSPHSSNPDAETGSFSMRGSYSGGQLQLFAGEWIDQPAGYETVDLRADVGSDNPAQIDGEVVDSTDACGTFSVQRTAG